MAIFEEEREPIITFEGDVIVFSAPQAEKIFFHLPPGRLGLCVAAPYCLWVTSVAQARQFFEDRKSR
jgi:hypothetical protein